MQAQMLEIRYNELVISYAALEKEHLKLLARVKKLEKQSLLDSWTLNPDRQGGAFTEQDRDNYGWK